MAKDPLGYLDESGLEDSIEANDRNDALGVDRPEDAGLASFLVKVVA